MVVAVSITQNPTLVNMLRSTEIPMSFITEAIYWSQFPDPLSIVGSLIVSMRNQIKIVNKFSYFLALNFKTFGNNALSPNIYNILE